MREYTEQLGLALGVRGLMNVQFALKDDVVCVLEVNPRASRTVPYASKATGLNLAYKAAQVMAGKTLQELGVTHEPRVDGFFVKEAVLPFKKLPGSSSLLGPEMRSDGTRLALRLCICQVADRRRIRFAAQRRSVDHSQ
jgi:carbamoyl-phosphate synthase large subunit